MDRTTCRRNRAGTGVSEELPLQRIEEVVGAIARAAHPDRLVRVGHDPPTYRTGSSRFAPPRQTTESESYVPICLYFAPENMSKDKYDEVTKNLEDAGQGSPDGRMYHAAFEGRVTKTFDNYSVLAATHAECGHFDKFVELQAEAIKRAPKDEELKKMLKLYQEGKPFRHPPKTATPAP